jgi:hypothetical protein
MKPLTFFAAILAVAVLVSSSAIILNAQQTRGVIVGRVTDPTGAAVPGAQVTLLNTRTGISTSAAAGATGDYVFTNLDPGTYQVTVGREGVKTSVVQGLTLFVSETVRADVKLDVGEVSSRIEVAATAPVVQSETSSVGNVVDGNQVTTMPLNGRGSIYSLLALAPGVQNAGSNPLVSGGTWVGSTNMSVDGATNNDVGNERLLAPIPSLDAIAEFKLIANGASAEFGRGGAQVVVATKSGSNEMHGSLFAFNRNRATAARNFFSATRPAYNRNEFGGSLGGPIVRNKLFYFGSFEGLRLRQSSTTTSSMPTAALRAGNFAGLSAIKDPWSSAPFPDNVIPASRIHSVAKELMTFTTDPNQAGTGAAGLGNNLVVNIPRREPMDRYSGRADYQMTDSDRFTVRYYHVNNGPFSAPSSGTDKFGNWGGFGIATRNAMGSYTRVISAAMINEFRFGFNSEADFRTPQNSTYDPSKIIPGLISPLEGLGGLPTVSITGFKGFSDQPGSGDLKHSYEFFDNFTWTRNKHTIKAGAEFQRANAFNWQNPSPYRGQFTFNGRYSGNAFADFLLGALSASGRVSKNVESEPLNSRYGAYIQDDWNVLPKLTVNLGMRYEYAPPFQNARGDMSNFYPDLGKVVLLAGVADSRLMSVLPIVSGESVGLDTGNYVNKDRNNLGPRLGFAWRPLGTTRFVVRSSYGIYYNVVSAYSGYFHLALNPPFRVTESFESSTSTVPNLTWDNPFPGTGTIPTSATLYAISRDRRNPYHQQWNFTLEYELLRNMAVRASYVGNKGTHLERNFNLNDPPQAPGTVQPRRPYQPFGSINYYESGRDSITHQMQLGAVRRFASGMAFQIEYQFTRALGEHTYGNAPMDNTNSRLDRGNLDYIRRHYAAANYMYDLPFGKGKRWLASLPGAAEKLAGGWQLAGILTMGGGQPYSVSFTSTTTGWTSSRADIVGNPALDNPTIRKWFNTAAFAVPQPFTYGNSARNLLFGPGFYSWDAAVFKSTPLTEKLNLEFRAESFNLFNHANFGNPASNISVPATVGTISSASDGRTIQFGLRLSF